MATDTSMDLLQKRKLAQGMTLVPPPPPPVMTNPPPAYTPPASLFSSGPGAMQPMMQPQYDNTPPAQQISLPPPVQATPSVPIEYFQNLQNNAQRESDQADAVQQAYNNFKPAPLPQQPQLSPFEQTLDKAMQDRMTKLLTNNDSVGDRFNKGYNVGQKLATNILAPLMGTFSKHAGTAIGTAEAMQGLRQQAAENDRTTQAEKAARNATLAQMSQMWEGMSPESSKNLMALASARLQAQQKNDERQQALLKDSLQARQNSTQAANTAAAAMLGLSKDDWERVLAKHKSDVADAQTASEIQGRGFNEQNESKKDVLAQNADKRADEELLLAKDSAQRSKDALTAKNNQDTTTNNFRKSQQQIDALKTLMGRQADMEKTGSAAGMWGQQKYPGYAEKMMQNPGYTAEMNALIQQAGLGGKITAEGMLQSQQARQVLQDAAKRGGPSVLDQAGSAAAAGGAAVMNGLYGGAGDAPASSKSALPDKPQAPAAKASIAPETVDQVIRDLIKKNGRQPSPDEIRKAVNMQGVK